VQGLGAAAAGGTSDRRGLRPPGAFYDNWVDIGTVLVAVIGAAGGGAVTAVGATLRNRVALRSAARLIHAELTENTAPVRYFRNVGSWPPSTGVRHAAWDQYALTLSKVRSAGAFHSIQKGYSALEGITFISQAAESPQALPPEVVTQVLDLSIGDVRGALEMAGNLAGIPAPELRLQVTAMEEQASVRSDQGALLAKMNAGAIPASTLDAIAHAGSGAQIEAATKTLEVMEKRLTPLPGKARQPQRRVFDAGGKGDLLNLALAREEGDPATGDATVDELFDGLGASYDFFSEVFDRDSIDGKGQPLEAVAHYLKSYNNIFWDGKRIVAGDGDGEIFKSFTASLELIGHEVSFGIVSFEAGFNYVGQSGALTQSLTNVFGVLIKQYKLDQEAADADWLLGAGVFGPKVNGVALQSMAAPGTAYDDPVLGKDPQPAHMKDYVETVADNGGVHTNVGIPDHAFYTIAMILGGHAWERAGRIWYEALSDARLKPTTNFRTFARTTRATAARLYGDRSDEAAAVLAGWEKVGIQLSRRRA
jgi:Thermolysin metallopeptidase, alpha-helical domain/Thermolysin metallopeptidase, catalytic domain